MTPQEEKKEKTREYMRAYYLAHSTRPKMIHGSLKTEKLCKKCGVVLQNALANWAAGNVGVVGDVTVALTGIQADWSAGNVGVEGTAPPLFVGGGPSWFKQYPLLKDRKKKNLPPVLELEHVTVIPQREVNYEEPLLYKYLHDIGPQIAQLQVETIAYKAAVEKAIQLNEKLKRTNNHAIMLAILYE